MSQLERDLNKHIRDRLGRWAQDSIRLFEMADLDDDATSAVLSTLVSFTAFMLTQVRMDPEKAGAMLTEAMIEMGAEKRRRSQ